MNKLPSLSVNEKKHPAKLNTGWQSSDPLGEALHFLHLSGVFYTRSEFRGDWGLALPAIEQCLMFHVVTKGNCWLVVNNQPIRQLHIGEFILIPHGQGHSLMSDLEVQATDLFDTERQSISERYEVLRLGTGEQVTHMVCGAVSFHHPAAQQLIRMLPQYICVDKWQSQQQTWFESTLRLMAEEVNNIKAGGETIITRLADILVIQAIRFWISENPFSEKGWLSALQDKKIGNAILAIQRQPEYEWTVELLAQQAAMSRSAFAERFKLVVGQSPMQYVTQWRMFIAETWLKENDISVYELAHRLGYRSEAAFSRAFKKYVGISPSMVERIS